MNNNIIGIVVGVLLTVILGLYAGVSTAEGSNTPLIVIGSIAALVGLFAMKDKVWYLLVLAPFVTMKVPGLGKFLFFELMLGAVIPFYLFNVFLSRIKLTWVLNKYLDGCVLLILVVIISLMVRFPIGLNVWESSDYVNSRTYFDILLAVAFFVVLSTIKTDGSNLTKAMYVAVIGWFLSVLATLGLSITNASYMVDDDMVNSRFGLLMRLGSFLVIFIICRYNVRQILFKPWVAATGVMGLGFVALSGFRAQIGELSLIFMTVSLAVRRYFDLLITPICGACGLVLITLVIGIDNLPRGIQRSISFIPGIGVDANVKKEAEESTEWRVEMWERAMNDNEKYIKDRMWGDGFAMKRDDLIKLDNSTGETQDRFAATGLWHSGPISTIHRMGFVGLGVVSLLLLGIMYYGYLVCRIYARQSYGWVVMMLIAPYVAGVVRWYLIFGDISYLYREILPVALIKQLLSMARKDGLYKSVKEQRDYVPLMVRESGSAHARAGGERMRPLGSID